MTSSWISAPHNHRFAQTSCLYAFHQILSNAPRNIYSENVMVYLKKSYPDYAPVITNIVHDWLFVVVVWYALIYTCIILIWLILEYWDKGARYARSLIILLFKTVAEIFEMMFGSAMQIYMFPGYIHVVTCIIPSHDDVIKWNHFPRYWLFVRGIYRSPVNFPALMFSLICARINGWVNNRKAGNLRCHHPQNDVIVMCHICYPSFAIDVMWKDLCEANH